MHWDSARSPSTKHPTARQDPSEAYRLLQQLKPFLRNGGKTWGLLFDQEDKERTIEDGRLVLTCRHNFTLPWDPRATDGSTWPEGGAAVVRLQPDEYLIAGNGVVVDFKTQTEKQQEEQKRLGEDGFALADTQPSSGSPSPSQRATTFQGKRCGILSVDQVSIQPDGTLQYIRRDNGDQDHQGRHARIGVGEYKILHVKLYLY